MRVVVYQQCVDCGNASAGAYHLCLIHSDLSLMYLQVTGVILYDVTHSGGASRTKLPGIDNSRMSNVGIRPTRFENVLSGILQVLCI